MQAVADGQATPDNWPTVAGNDPLVQVVPPSVVLMLAPAVTLPFKPDPTAVQSAVEKQVIDSNPVIPDGTVWVDQVLPPSVETRTVFSPTAKHSDADGQDAPNSPPLTEIGSVATPQLVPPSVVTISAGTALATAMQ